MELSPGEQCVLWCLLAIAGLVVLALVVVAVSDRFAQRAIIRRHRERTAKWDDTHPVTPDEETPPEEWP